MISSELKKRTFTSTILLFLIYLIFQYNYFLLYSLIVLGTLSLIEFFNISKKIAKNIFLLFFMNIFFTIYISFFCIIFFSFSNFYQLKIILFCILLGCIASDIGGFLFGKIFKGPKLTKISPNKTISGAMGSIIFTIIIMISSIFYFTKIIDLKFFILACITSISCQLGDLFFSLLKRRAKIKDTGNFLPGHGGILDRLDGIYLGVPVSLIILLFL